MSTHPCEDVPIVEICDPQMHLSEATAGFYTDTTFHFDDPEVGLKWLHNITPGRVNKLRTVICRVYAGYNPGPYTDFLTDIPPNGPKWCEFLHELATQASNLEEAIFYLYASPCTNHWGPAVDINFVRALGGFSSLRTCLRKLELRGYFPEEWVPYLETKTGLKVWEEAGQHELYLWILRTFRQLIKYRNPDMEGWMAMLQFVDT